MNEKPKVIFNNVSKKYTLHRNTRDKILELIRLKKSKKSFFALRNVSFSVSEGETIGVIGINGSGKSTLSNLLAEVIPPSNGDITLDGEPSLIAISVGLNNNLTGLENIELKCLMHGLKKDEIKKITPKIIEFAEIGDFIDQPVKNYSSGMKSRLGFAISAHTNPDIMIIDEALSVGDPTFTEKCIKKMNEFKKEGKTIFFISHSTSQIRSFCDRVMWLHYGELVDFGETHSVLKKYKEFIQYFNNLSEEERRKYKKEKMAIQKLDEAELESGNSRLNRSSKKEKKGKSGFFGLAVLFFLFILSSFLMLNHNLFQKTEFDDRKSENNVISSSVDEKTEINFIEKEISLDGYIAKESERVYHDADLKNELTILNFSEHVYVKKQIGNVYEISIENNKGYIETESVVLAEQPFVQHNFSIEQIKAGFPQSFLKSYEYFLVFLDSDLEQIETKLRGKTDEGYDELGNKYISYADVQYRINSDNISDAIIINNFNPQNININEIIEIVNLKSQDNRLLYLLTDTNGFIMDLNKNTVMITSVNQ